MDERSSPANQTSASRLGQFSYLSGARPTRGLIGIISSDGVGGVMARRLLPAAIAVPALLGWLRLEGEKAGYYDRSFGVALMAVSSIVIFGALVFWSALSLERADAKRKEAERGRQKSAEEQERFFTLSLDLLCIAGFDGYFKRMNPAWEKVLGFSREELLAKPFIEFVHPNDRAATEQETRKLATGGAVIAFGNRYRCKDGSYRRLLWNAASQVEQGLIYAVARDVTEQKQAEEILRQSEERTRLIVDTAYDAFVAIDAAGYITGWNKQAEATFGWSRDEAVGRKLAETIIPAVYRERHERGMKHFQTTGEGPVLNKRIELVALHRDGREFPVELTIWPIQVGDTFFFNAFLRDITERKRAEEKIKHLNEDLEHRASLLETANKELEAFSYSVSHDLRAPLRHIDGYADLVRKGAGAMMDETGRRYLATISESAKQMGRLIDDLLVFSRMGRAELRHAPVDLNALAEETINVLQADVNGRNVEWKKGALPKVTGDAAMLRQVFVNLLSNAVKYTGPRDPALIEIGCMNGAPDEFVVFVRDNGVGFDMEYAGKLFGVFQRLHNSDDFEGTGIGLANVRRIIQRHGGRTWAEGKVDAGATFYFSLPQKQQRAENSL